MDKVKYMAVLHGTRGSWAQLSEERQVDLMKKYNAWADKLKAEKRFDTGSELRENYRSLKNVKGTVHVDGPFAETKEILTGYFVIHARSIDEAAEICKECPALLHGDWVQVYELPNRREGL